MMKLHHFPPIAPLFCQPRLAYNEKPSLNIETVTASSFTELDFDNLPDLKGSVERREVAQQALPHLRSFFEGNAEKLTKLLQNLLVEVEKKYNPGDFEKWNPEVKKKFQEAGCEWVMNMPVSVFILTLQLLINQFIGQIEGLSIIKEDEKCGPETARRCGQVLNYLNSNVEQTQNTSSQDPKLADDSQVALGKQTEIPTPQGEELPQISEPVAEVVGHSEAPEGTFLVGENVDPGMKTFIEQMPREGRVWAENLEGNGGRSVLTYVPPNFDPAKPAKIIVNFHGTFSQHIESFSEEERKDKNKTFGKAVGWDRLSQATGAANKLNDYGENVILVYPLSSGGRFYKGSAKKKKYDHAWMDTGATDKDGKPVNDDFDQMYAEVLGGLQENFGFTPKINKVSVEGHSAGGVPLRNIAQSYARKVKAWEEGGRQGPKPPWRITDIVFKDASFQGWAEYAHNALKKAGESSNIILIIDGKNTASSFPINYEPSASDPLQMEWARKVDKKNVPTDQLHRTDIEGVYLYVSSDVAHKEMVEKFTGGLYLLEHEIDFI